MYAVIEDRHQQFRVAPGERVLLPHRAGAEPGATLRFEKVCAVGGDEAQAPRIGTPYVAGVAVAATVVGMAKGPKLTVAKFRRRKNSKRRTGFRARYTEVVIDRIEG